MGFDLDSLVRENVRRLVPYSSARGEFAGTAQIFLDANENSLGSPIAEDYSRYPDPMQAAVKEKIAEINGVRPQDVFVGNGSDEAIDLLFRIFCRPQIDNVLICPPTYGMYEVAAGLNDVAVRRVNLTSEFELDPDAVQRGAGENTKLIFLCSPNNPTGNSIDRESVLGVLNTFQGIAVVDEAYIHFCDESSLIPEIKSYPNLVVLQTFSKAWGLAGLRVGLAFANEAVIELFNKVKPPYNVSQVAQKQILAALENRDQVDLGIANIVKERKTLSDRLSRIACVKQVYPSDANFLLVKVVDANDVYRFLLDEWIVVRNRSTIELCEGCLRVTVGTPHENKALIRALEKYEKSPIY